MKVDRCPTCKRRMTRSQPQNARYWALLHLLSDKLQPQGKVYSVESWHNYCKSRFLGCDEFPMPTGKTMIIPKSSANLDVAEFGEFMDKVEAWANTDHNIYLEDVSE
jgi:hypothetical protein